MKACANCHWRGHEKRCTFYVPRPSELQAGPSFAARSAQRTSDLSEQIDVVDTNSTALSPPLCLGHISLWSVNAQIISLSSF